jgi:hypothetical protein
LWVWACGVGQVTTRDGEVIGPSQMSPQPGSSDVSTLAAAYASKGALIYSSQVCAPLAGVGAVELGDDSRLSPQPPSLPPPHSHAVGVSGVGASPFVAVCTSVAAVESAASGHACVSPAHGCARARMRVFRGPFLSFVCSSVCRVFECVPWVPPPPPPPPVALAAVGGLGARVGLRYLRQPGRRQVLHFQPGD